MSVSTVFDVVVFGGTAPGIVAAIRLARQGIRVALVSSSMTLGGSLPSLGALETHYRGNRAPLLQEISDAVRSYYRNHYGENSEQYRTCSAGKMVTFEPRVMEAILVASEANIQVWLGYFPLEVKRGSRVLNAVSFVSITDRTELELSATVFVEAGYEGDLMALAGVRWRLGRESREEFAEPRAGRVFTRWLSGGVHPKAAAEGRLNLVTAQATTSEPLPESSGEGDDNIQSYSYRLCLTDEPANRRLLMEPPPGYDRARYAPILLSTEQKQRIALPFHHRFLIQSLREMAERDHIFHGHALPNRKRSWNATNLTGAGKRWAESDANGRAEIARQHLEHALGLMWFLQTDPEIPADLRATAKQWGLARDEFASSGNIPPQLYVREARRLVGRCVFTEHDALLAPGLQRAPVHQDSIAITEFSLDSLACTTDRVGDSLCDGQLFQMENSVPGQVPYGVLLPHELDNFLVVTTVSATHVGWGTIRQTPTLMHLAESAAWAVVVALKAGIPPATVEVAALQRTLVAQGVMITFFSNCDMTAPDDWVQSVQLAGTRGEYSSYDASVAKRE
ncbi:MAG TPA: FAD-dependent oxidoreductase [Opitutaceae bacterium]|nr:FAD-dependent oxidoreductase [Opitutaceae bacterium]